MVLRRITRRRALATLGVGVPAVLVGRPLTHLGCAAWRDRDDMPKTPAGSVDDASHLNETPVAEIYSPPSDMAEAEAGLRRVLASATERGRAVSIAGARHTMGGHTQFPGGVVVDMSAMNRLELDGEVLRAQSGARWADVIAFLHPRGRSVAVMQSNDSFSVGGTLSANAHGWQPNRPPVACTVKRMRVMIADGSVVVCDRERDRELFTHVLGGYGLFGLILDVELETVANVMYRAERVTIPSEAYVATFAEKVTRAGDVGLAYGRLCIDPKKLLREAMLTTFRHDPSFSGAIPPLVAPENSRLKRAVFRGSVESAYGKSLRWDLEKALGGEAGDFASRNQILSEPVSLFQNHDAAYTDILHEYFVPPEGFAPFLDRARAAIDEHAPDLLNVTVRNVLEDDDAVMRYADKDVFALVMLFTERRDVASDERMARFTRTMIDHALAVGGRYYLPYRLHATREQLRRAYPQVDAFFATKKKYDPRELFRNRFYAAYA